MVFQSYHECFILLKSCAMRRLSVYTVSKRRKRKKGRNPHAFSWFKFYSRMEGRILWRKHSARLEFKEIEGTRSSLLPVESQGWEGEENKTETKAQDVLALYQLPLSHLPLTSQDPFSYSSRKLWFLQSPRPWQLWRRAPFVSSGHLFFFPTKKFLCIGFCFPGLHSAVASVGSIKKPQYLPSPVLTLPNKPCFMLCFLNNKGHTMTFGDRSVREKNVGPGSITLPCLTATGSRWLAPSYLKLKTSL